MKRYLVSYTYIGNNGQAYADQQLDVEGEETDLEIVNNIKKHLANNHEIDIKKLVILNIININKLIE